VRCNKKTIWNFAQNKPTLIVSDIVKKYPNVNPDFVYEVLLKRGVFKWLAVRRDLIKLKDIWKEEITRLNRRKTKEEKGYYKALLKCRAEVRKLCHSDRFRAPDFDNPANEFLRRINIAKGGHHE
jgi:hypothetical protein